MSSQIDVRESSSFKKKAHRPWNPTVLENASEESPGSPISTQTLETRAKEEYQAAFLQKQMELSIDEKNHQLKDLQRQLSLKSEKRIMVGGFLQPKNILFLNELEEFQTSKSLKMELQEKEYEVLNLTANLKITQAQEQMHRAEENARRSEEAQLQAERARKMAEDNLYYITLKAERAEEKIKILEDYLNDEKHSRMTVEQQIERVSRLEEVESELEQALRDRNHLEEKLIEFSEQVISLHNNNIHLSDKCQTAENHMKQLEAINASERNLRDKFEEKAKLAFIQFQLMQKTHQEEMLLASTKKSIKGYLKALLPLITKMRTALGIFCKNKFARLMSWIYSLQEKIILVGNIRQSIRVHIKIGFFACKNKFARLISWVYNLQEKIRQSIRERIKIFFFFITRTGIILEFFFKNKLTRLTSSIRNLFPISKKVSSLRSTSL